MELANILEVLWRRKWIILGIAVIASVAAIGLVMQIPDQYSTSVLLRVKTPTNGGWGNTLYGDRLNNTYNRVIQSDAVMLPLMEAMDLENPPEVNLGAINNTELLQLTVNGRNPEIANWLADFLVANSREFYYGEVAESSISISDDLDSAIAELESLYLQFSLVGDNPILRSRLSVEDQVLVENAERRVEDLQTYYDATFLEEEQQATSIYVLQYAEPPTSPDGPNRPLLIILGVAVAGFASLGMAFIFENLDSRLYSSQQIQEVVGSLPLAYIPMTKALSKTVEEGKTSLALENFRTLRTNLFAMLNLDEQSRSIVVTSADPKEGKSTVVAFLAAVTAQAGHKVVLIDGDLRISRQHNLYGVENSRGLSDVLNGYLEVEDVIQHNESGGVDLVPAGNASSNAAELLASDQMDALLAQLKEEYDVVLVDSPALTVVADATQIATQVDNVLLIVTRQRSTRDGVKRAMDQLQQVGASIVGVVINNAEKQSMQSYYQAIAKSADTSQGGGRSGKGAEVPKPSADDEKLAGGATTA